MTKEDVQAVYNISTVCFSNPWSLEALQSEVEKLYLVAEIEGQIVGYVGLQQMIDEGEIMNVAVSPTARQKGVGKLLLSTLIEEAKKMMIGTIYLEVRQSNKPARNLYEAFGFKAYAIRKNYYHKPKEDAVLYRKSFSDKCT